MRDGKCTGAAGDGVYRYRTRSGVRWRFVFRRADGRLSSRRGFATRAAAATARNELIEMLRTDTPATEPSQFAAFFAQIVKEKRAYLTVGALEDLESHGRTRLIPFFADSELATIDERDVRDWLALMCEDVEAGELSAKTVNNARTWLAVVFNEAVRRRQMARNPVKTVPRPRTWRPSWTTYASRRSIATSTRAHRTTGRSRSSSSARALGSQRRSR